MKKRLISLLLAFSMMLTFLPAGAVSAFAEENTIDPEKGVLLQSGDTINDKFIEEHDGATTYQMRDNYASGVTISASKKVTINITGNIDYNGALFNVLNSGNVMVENNKNYTVKGGARVVSLVQGTITVDGGTYYGSGTETFLNFRHNQGVMWLNDINVIASRDNAVNNQGGEVHIKGGTYTSNSSPVIYNQTWDRDSDPGAAELVGIMTLTDVTVESTSSGTGTGVGNSGNLTITGGKVTAPGPALNTYPKGETTVESGDFSSTGDCAVRVYEKLYLKGGTFTAPNGSAIQSRDDSAHTEISGGTIKDSKVGVEVVKGSVDLKKTTFQGNNIDIYLQEDQVITIESSFKNAATVGCADPKDGRQLTKATETDYQKNLNLTSANEGYLVGYKKTTDGKEYRCLSKEVGVTINGLEGAIKAEDPAEFTVTLTHENSTGTGILTFGDKNSEIEYKDEHGAYQRMPDGGLPIDLASDKNDYAFRIIPQKAGDQKLTAAVVRDAVELGTAEENFTVAGRVHTTVAIEGLEDAVIKEGESKDFTVKVDPKDDAKLGEAVIDFGDKNGEIEYKGENGEYKPMPEGGLKIDLGDGEVEREFRIAPKETGKQTLTAAVKQDKNELAKDEKDFVVSEMPILTLKDGVITSVTVPGKNGADPEDITEIVKKNANEDGSFNVPEGATVSVAFDKDAFADSGLKFGHWDITGLDDPNAYQDKESFDFVMPAKGVTLKAMTQDASIEDDEPDIVGPIVIGTTVVVGGAVLGYQAYSLGAEFAGKLMALPYFPSNRSALAMMLWEDAGKPMPESELLYPDVGQEEQDMDLQHAARWAMENELIPDLNDEGTAPEEMKFYPDNTVSKIDVLKAWQKAQELKQNA